MSKDGKFGILQVEWNYTRSKERGLDQRPPIRLHAKRIIGYCTVCGDKFDAREGHGRNSFITAIGVAHVTCRCGVDDEVTVAELDQAG